MNCFVKETLLHIASKHNHITVARYLLDHGAKVDARDKNEVKLY